MILLDQGRLALRLPSLTTNDNISHEKINIFSENNGTMASMDLCTVLLLNKQNPTNSNDQQKCITSYENHATCSRTSVCGQRCIPLAITLIFVSFNLPRMLSVNKYYSKQSRFKKYKTFSVLIYSYINTSGN